MRVIFAMEYALSSNLLHFLFESDSRSVVLACSKPSMVPWSIRKKWNRCLLGFKSRNFFVHRIYRKGN